jgi:hypothetical protein
MEIVDVLKVVPEILITLALLIIAIRGFRRIEAKVGSVHVTAEAVNRAVNNVPADSPTLRQMVCDISSRLEEHITQTNDRFDKIEEHITNPERVDNVPTAQ